MLMERLISLQSDEKQSVSVFFSFFSFISGLSRRSRLLPQPAEESDAGQGGRRRPHRVPAQDVSLGGGLLAQGQRAAAGKQQVSQLVSESVSHAPPGLTQSV